VITVGAMKTMGTQSRADDLIATCSSKGPSMLDQSNQTWWRRAT
jgi:hypothetical protein